MNIYSLKMIMKFWDRVKVKVMAWDGGNGCTSWRKEKYIAYGWPDGWDGWKWWDIFFEADEWLSSLIDLHYRKQIKSWRWEHGRWSDQYWENADDVIVKVPVGTIIKDINSWEILWTLLKHWEKIVVARGGRWWWGNIHFKNSVKQYPDFSMYWEPGEEREIEAELQLIWDVTLIWFPSVGKSSIINTLSNSRAKVAEYSFTTLVPNLWVVKHKNKDFVLVDVPWLIEWSWNGRWLWNEFLRHILKSKIWTFVLDVDRYEDSFKELKTLKNELETFVKIKVKEEFNFDEGSNIKFSYEKYTRWLIMKVYLDDKLLFSKFILFVLNKVDLAQDKEILDEFMKELVKNVNLIFLNDKESISSDSIFQVFAGNKNLFEDYLNLVVDLLDIKLNQDTILDDYLQPKWGYIKQEKKIEPYVKDITDIEMDFLIENWYLEEEKAENLRVFEVWNKKLAYYSYILPWGNKEAEMLFFDVMKWEWISKWLEQNWVMIWDILKIKSPYSWKEDRYIEWKL